MSDGALELINGVPFLDDGFAPTHLTAAVVAVRQNRAARIGLPNPADPRRWLTPDHACLVRFEASEVPSIPLTQDEDRKVSDSLVRLEEAVPAWAPLLWSLPMRYARIASGESLSASSFWWPQHILLGTETLASDLEMREHVLHEHCHQWLYLIEELWDIDRPEAPTFTLPSGTSNRSPREVIGAAHVAAALIRMYRAVGEKQHIEPLKQYGLGCIKLLESATRYLTPVGTQITQRIKEEL
ncbi:aKG-HExxH-type peptide beta-hydroxylase [Streptomyces sp. NPDC048462]|uniref:aKG-HExxH-type peptide beta-hydroxylase n=1 Tax=Streptomyces sp. NPDC048462 TaxID=3365555 RepID=UPI00371BB7DB